MWSLSLRPCKRGIYHPGKWRGWYDFGNGSIGDFCCHSFNMPVRALKLGLPSRVEINNVHDAGHETYARAVTHRFTCRRFTGCCNPSTTSEMRIRFQTDSRCGAGYFGNIPRAGAILEGSNGLPPLTLVWSTLSSKMTRSSLGTLSMGTPPASRSSSFANFQEWIDAILGKGKTQRPLSWAEIGLSGIAALKLQNNPIGMVLL